MWAAAHVALSARGAAWVDARGGVTALVDLAEKCTVFSLKATAFYAIGLVATTRVGCKALAARGWYSLRHGRDERWPVLEDWFRSSSASHPVSADNQQKQVRHIYCLHPHLSTPIKLVSNATVKCFYN